MKHYSVLKQEAIEGLKLRKNSIIVDATLGYGGHSSEILKQIPEGHLYAFDKDSEAIMYAKERLEKVGSSFTILHQDYKTMKSALLDLGVSKVDGILFDLGVSSPQLDDEHRGFSFMRDEVLDMRMNQEQSLDAKVVIHTYSKEQLADLFFRYGEEKQSKKIAAYIVQAREKKSIETTKELVDIIQNAVGANYFYKTHPERNIFQAIRIEVNQELTNLEKALPDALSLLNVGGRICVITFHSLEDRIVKNVFKQVSEVDEMVKGLPVIPKAYLPKYRIVNHKPIVPSAQEMKENSRSRSAKLRIIERIHDDEKE